MQNQIKKVMIFDDDEDILFICTTVLEKQGWQVYTFTDCMELTERVAQILPDVIFMDNWIPDLGGMAASQTLKKREDLLHIPIIYFSANNDIQSLAKKAGAETFLAKPFDLEELKMVINRVIRNNP